MQFASIRGVGKRDREHGKRCRGKNVERVSRMVSRMQPESERAKESVMQQRDRCQVSTWWMRMCLWVEGVKQVCRRYGQTVPVAGIEVSGRALCVIVTFGGRWVKDRQNQRVSHGIRVATRDFGKVPYLLMGVMKSLRWRFSVRDRCVSRTVYRRWVDERTSLVWRARCHSDVLWRVSKR